MEEVIKYEIDEWIQGVLENPIPKEVVALCFNLYECEEYRWEVELIGSGSFHEDDMDWACDEIYNRRDCKFHWYQRDTFDIVLRDCMEIMRESLMKYKDRYLLTSFQGIGIGFVDGDIHLLTLD